MMSNNKQLKEKITNFLNEADGHAFESSEISDHIGYRTASQFKDVAQTLAELERTGLVEVDADGKFSLVKQTADFEGTFSASTRGFGFVKVEDQDEDLFIPPNATMFAMNRDIVGVKQVRAANEKEGKGPEGKIVEIIERGTSSLIGEFIAYGETDKKESGFIGYVQPQDKKLQDMVVYIQSVGIHPENHHMVQLEITNYPDLIHEKSMTGMVTTDIGSKNAPGVDIMSVIYKHGIPTDFSNETLAETEEIPDTVDVDAALAESNRIDLRDLQTVTIDGESAKDLDDAISISKKDNGNYLLGVHIADVSHYVAEGSALDEDAFERGTSVYLVDRVVPMLPQKLSNGVCSLNPNVPRLAISAMMEINDEGNVLDYTISPSVIESDQRMTYTAVNGILEDHDSALCQQYADYVDMFEMMADLHHILEAKRIRRGAINFDTKEAQVIVDENGVPTDIVLRERGVGERLIESFALVANETVSEHYNKKHLPILYRVHEHPDKEKLQNFVEFAGQMGIEVKGSKGAIHPRQLQNALDKVTGSSEETVITMTLLRSMQQARYDTEALGHYGLAAKYYSHFTSPIRRYPDLTLHRMIHYYAEVGTSTEDKNKWKQALPEIAEHSSVTERRAIDAEREVDEMKKIEYMQDQVGEEFDATIVSVLSFGMFIELENTVEGLVHISTMNQDYFEYNEKGLQLIGQHTGVTYRVGQTVRVKMTGADVDNRELNFELVLGEDAPKYERPKRQHSHDSHGNGRHNNNNKHNHKYKSSKNFKQKQRKSR